MRVLFLLLLAVSSAWAQSDSLPDTTGPREFADRIAFTRITYENGLGAALESPQSVTYDRYADEVYVCATGNRAIAIFDTNLVARAAIRHYVTDPQTRKRIPGEPRAVAVNKDGDMYVLDNLVNYIDVLDFRGVAIDRIYPNKLLNDTSLTLKPSLLAMDDSGKLYVMVSGDVQTILVIDQDLNLVRRIGKRGDEVADFNTPVGMTVFDSLLVVTDLYGIPACKVFDTSGNYLSGFGGHEIGKTDLSMASGVAADRDSTGLVRFWICDALRQVVKVINQNGEFISNVGGFGVGPGQYQYPSGLAAGRNNTFYISERIGARIQKFKLK